MDEEKNNDEKNLTENGAENQPTKSAAAFFYVAICACALGAVAFGLAFTKLGVYSLIAAVVFELAALAFCNSAKKAGAGKPVKYVRICAYVLLAVLVLFFIGGIIYASTKS